MRTIIELATCDQLGSTILTPFLNSNTFVLLQIMIIIIKSFLYRYSYKLKYIIIELQ